MMASHKDVVIAATINDLKAEIAARRAQLLVVEGERDKLRHALEIVACADSFTEVWLIARGALGNSNNGETK